MLPIRHTVTTRHSKSWFVFRAPLQGLSNLFGIFICTKDWVKLGGFAFQQQQSKAGLTVATIVFSGQMSVVKLHVSVAP